MGHSYTSRLLVVLTGLLLLCNCVLGSTIPVRSLRAREAYRNRPAGPGVSKPRSISVLAKRDLTPPVPSVETIQQHLSVGADKAVFYSSDVQPSADAYADANGMKTIWTAGLTDYQNALDAEIEQAEKDGKETWDTGDYTQFWINASQAFAKIASGVVTAVLPAGSDGNVYLPAESFFTVHEYPILKDSSQNAGVTKVMGLVGSDQETPPNGQLTQMWPCGN